MVALIDEIHALEAQLLDADVRRSEAALKSLLDPEFIEIGASGRQSNRDEIIKALSSEKPVRRKIEAFSIRVPGDGIILASYKVTRFSEDGAPLFASLRTSIWRESSTGWRLFFHQGTPAPESGG